MVSEHFQRLYAMSKGPHRRTAIFQYVESLENQPVPVQRDSTYVPKKLYLKTEHWCRLCGTTEDLRYQHSVGDHEKWLCASCEYEEIDAKYDTEDED